MTRNPWNSSGKLQERSVVPLQATPGTLHQPPAEGAQPRRGTLPFPLPPLLPVAAGLTIPVSRTRPAAARLTIPVSRTRSAALTNPVSLALEWTGLVALAHFSLNCRLRLWTLPWFSPSLSLSLQDASGPRRAHSWLTPRVNRPEGPSWILLLQILGADLPRGPSSPTSLHPRPESPRRIFLWSLGEWTGATQTRT